MKKKKRKVPKHYKKRTETARQRIAQQKLVENGRSQRQALKEAGYSDAYANQPGKFRKTKAGQEVIKFINDHCKKIEKQMQKKITKARYNEASMSYERLQKLKRLMSGESTENLTIEDLIRRRKLPE